MSAPVISVLHLGKRYTLGYASHDTLRDHITHAIKSLLKRSNSNSNSDHNETDFWALKDVSFNIAEGEVVGIIGRNGAGKSTLLKILSQITEPTEGEVRIRGRVASLLEVGTGFHPELSGRENIFLNGAILGMSRSEIRSKFDEIVRFAEVEKFLDTPVKRYSSGMYVRLAFAVAAHLNPEILLVDEVLAVGDTAFQQKCLQKMDDVAKGGRTVIFVSHNMAAMGALCTHGIYIESGSIKQEGSIAETINAYITDSSTATRGRHFNPTHRSGNGLVRITHAELSSGKLRDVVVCGAGMELTLSYEAEQPSLPIQFLIGIYDDLNTRVLFLDSFTVKGLPVSYPDVGTLRLKFDDNFSLFPGTYTMNMAVVVHGENADYIQNAIALRVEEGDFFGTGKLPRAKASVLYRNDWQLLS